uniref:Uncharacterized protein n=1 Tax=Fusarium oxysporum (strain Fo5176) TaxID=660025 RepID=A0A0D2XQ44_FUSOF
MYEPGCVSSGARHKTSPNKSSPIDIGGLCFGEMVADFRIDRAELEGFQAESVGAGLKEFASIGGQVSCTCYRQWDTMEYMSCSGLLSFDPRGGCLRQMWLVVVMYRHGSRTEYDAINNHRDLSPWVPGFFLTDLYAPSIMAAELVLVHA